MNENDLISRQAAIDTVLDWLKDCMEDKKNGEPLTDRLKHLPSVQRDTDEWCKDCSEYDSERHCCPRWNRVIRETLKDAQQWIPCSERPPEEQDEYYITWTSPICKGRRFVSITEYCIPRTGEEPYWDLSEHISFYEDAEVLAWMPLPEPWKGEQP